MTVTMARVRRVRTPLHVTTLLLLVVLLVCAWLPTPVHGLGVYVKLFPGREMCVNYHAQHDLSDGPIKVALVHRILDPRLIGIRTQLFGPNATSPRERGPQLQLSDTLNSFGQESHLYFDAHEQGMYTMCFRTPLRHPIVRFEMHFVSTVDEIDTPVTEDNVPVEDKPITMKDYTDELHLLDVAVETLHDMMRSYGLRQQLFHSLSRRTLYTVSIATLFNVLLAIGLSIVSERYLERYAVKQKLL